MNSFTKMILIPEDEYKRRCFGNSVDPIQSILTTNIPIDSKIRLANNVLMNNLEIQQQKRNQEIERQNNYTEQASPERFEISNIRNEKPDHSYNTAAGESSIYDTISGDMVENPRALNFDEAIISTPLLNSNKIVAQSEKLNQVRSPNKAVSLELALNNIQTLVSEDGKILRSDGTKIHNSDIKRIVKFLCLFKTSDVKKMITPPGTERVISEIEKLPYLFDLINNSPAVKRFGDKGVTYNTWKKLSEMNTTLSTGWEH